jgi:hypothetical protein
MFALDTQQPPGIALAAIGIGGSDRQRDRSLGRLAAHIRIERLRWN